VPSLSNQLQRQQPQLAIAGVENIFTISHMNCGISLAAAKIN